MQYLKSALGVGSSPQDPKGSSTSSPPNADKKKKKKKKNASEKELPKHFVNEKILIDVNSFPPGNTALGWLLGSGVDSNGLVEIEEEIGQGVELTIGGRDAFDGTNAALHIMVKSGSSEITRDVERAIRDRTAEAYNIYRQGAKSEAFIAPRTTEEMLFNLHVLCYARPDLPYTDVPEAYSKHFKHRFDMKLVLSADKKPSDPDDLLGALQKYPKLFEQYEKEGQPGVYCIRSALAEHATLPFLTAKHNDEIKKIRDAKYKRKRSDEDGTTTSRSSKRSKNEQKEIPVEKIQRPEDPIVQSTIKALHRVVGLATGGKGVMPISLLPLEFEKYWKIPIDVRAFGKPTLTELLLCFPKVFSVLKLKHCTGYVVEARSDANFDLAHEAQTDLDKHERQNPTKMSDDFVLCLAQGVADRCSKNYPGIDKLQDLSNVVSLAVPTPTNIQLLRMVETAYRPKHPPSDMLHGQFHNVTGVSSNEHHESEDDRHVSPGRSSAHHSDSFHKRAHHKSLVLGANVDRSGVRSGLARTAPAEKAEMIKKDLETIENAPSGKDGKGKGSKMGYHTQAESFEGDLDGEFEFSPTATGVMPNHPMPGDLDGEFEFSPTATGVMPNHPMPGMPGGRPLSPPPGHGMPLGMMGDMHKGKGKGKGNMMRFQKGHKGNFKGGWGAKGQWGPRGKGAMIPTQHWGGDMNDH